MDIALNKIKQFETQEDVETIKLLEEQEKALRKEYLELLDKADRDETPELYDRSIESIVEKLDEAMAKQHKLRESIEQRYIDHFNFDVKKLYQDCKEIIENITQEEFVCYTQNGRKMLQKLSFNDNFTNDNLILGIEIEQVIQHNYTESSDCLARYYLSHLRVQLEAIRQWQNYYPKYPKTAQCKQYKQCEKKIRKLAYNTACKYYPPTMSTMSVFTEPVRQVCYATDKITENLTAISKIEFAEQKQGTNRAIPIDVGNKHKKNKDKVYTYVKISYNGSIEDIPLDISNNDNVLLTAYHSVWETSKKVGTPDAYITPLQLYRVYTRNPDARLTPSKEFELLKTTQRLMQTVISINANSEAEKYGKVKYQYVGNLLYAEILKNIEINGNMVDTSIHILKEPINLSYAKDKNNIRTLPINSLNTPINKTEDNIALQQYLECRIVCMSSNNMSNRILYNTVYNHIGITSDKFSEKSVRTKQKRIRDTANDILTHFKKEKLIADFKPIKKGNKIHGVEIIPREKG